MPINLSDIGPPKPYPTYRLRLRPWLIVWAMCCVFGAVFVLLIWPTATPARGLWFWLCIVGGPQALFALMLGFMRAVYETEYLHALYYNQHRENRRCVLIARGQEPLLILAYAYQFPLDGQGLARTVIDGPPVLRTQPLQDGSTVVRHTRLLENQSYSEQVDSVLSRVLQQAPVTPYGRLYANLLVPVSEQLRALAEMGQSHLPVVELIVTGARKTGDQLQQLRAVIDACGVPPLECKLASDTDGLMLADAWLDSTTLRPLLVIAAQLHDVSPAESTEGGVAILLAKSGMRLSPQIEPLASLHRPVGGTPEMPVDGVVAAIGWGKASPAATRHAWITGMKGDENILLSSAFRQAGMSGISKADAWHEPDLAIGHAGAVAPWLSVAAATESAVDGPQILLNRTQTIQAAILYAHKKPSNENRADKPAN
jgi:hypothetical protein